MRLALISLLMIPLAVGCDGEKPATDADERVEGSDAGDCSDAADNDLDGLFDCDDDGCEGSPDCDEADVDADDTGEPAGTDEDGDGVTLEDGDCDDSDDAIYPGAAEVCNDLDDDCDGDADNGLSFSDRYLDDDGDGYGTADSTLSACRSVDGYADEAGDCNDGDSSVHPAAEEVCDGEDQDCDDEVDEGALTTWYLDSDLDGYGTTVDTQESSEAPDSYVELGTDCADSDATINPDAIEQCDGVDNNCDGETDEDSAADAITWYADSDSDTYGDPVTPDVECYQPTGYVEDNSDCNDDNAATYPGATEIWYDGEDGDCDALSDFDADYDGYDSDEYGGEDCDDDDGWLHPDTEWFIDLDGDGYGAADLSTVECDPGDGWSLENTDCDDDDGEIHPDAVEVCDEIDNDCDDAVDASDPDTGFCWEFVTTGSAHSCGLTTSGTVECWGSNVYGQSSPPSDTFAMVSAGQNHTCGVTTAGSIECWGSTADDRSSAPSGTFAMVSAGGYHGCAVTLSGSVECWGYNVHGQSSPPSGTFATVTAGDYHTCGLTTSGNVECWGAVSSAPAGSFDMVSGEGTWHSCGVTTSGSVECWGSDSYGESSPPWGSFDMVGAGSSHTCGVTTSGSVECWGLDSSGQASPPSGSFDMVSGGWAHSCGLTTSGSIECWGWNGYGQCSPPGP